MSIQIGVIGAGKWGKNILKTLASYPRTIAHIAYGGNEETGRFLQETYSTSAITKDYHEVLANPALEAVFIATPISTHGDIVRDALTAGKHVFVEKPLSTSTEEIATLYTLAEEKNLTLFPGYLYLFDPEFQALQVKTAAPDELSLEMCWEKYGTFDTPLAENLLVHELALAHELIGTLTLESVARNETDVCDITVRGERGTAHIFIDRTQKEKKKELTVSDGATIETTSFSHNNLLDLECDAFFVAVARGSEGNKKRQRIDESIAAVLASLPRP